MVHLLRKLGYHFPFSNPNESINEKYRNYVEEIVYMHIYVPARSDLTFIEATLPTSKLHATLLYDSSKRGVSTRGLAIVEM